MDSHEEALWRRLCECVLANLQSAPDAVLAFGSRVVGFAEADSDYDIYVIGDDYGRDPAVRASIAACAHERHSVTLDVHGCSPRHAALYRTLEPQLNAALRSGLVLSGSTAPLRPCPPLGRIGVTDVCASARVLLRERGAPDLVADAWRSLLLARSLLDEPPSWAPHYAALRAAPGYSQMRRQAGHLLRELVDRQKHLPETDDDRALLAVGRR